MSDLGKPIHDTTYVVGGASGFRERKTGKVPNRAVCSGIGGAIQDCAFGLSHLATTTSLMEARVTTATRRLRRTGVAGFAAAVTAGAMLIGTATSAFAAELTVTQQIGSTAATTLNPGTTAQGIGDLQIAVPNSFHIGDTITVSLSGAGAGSCGTTNGAVGFSAAPTATASGPFTAAFGTTAGATTDTTPTFTTALQSSAGACTVAGVKDQVLVTLTNSSTGTAGNSYTLSLTGQKVNVGSAVPTGAVNEGATSGGTAIQVATIANTKASITEVSAAPGLAPETPSTRYVLTEVTQARSFRRVRQPR